VAPLIREIVACRDEDYFSHIEVLWEREERVQMKRFPWIEVFMIVALAVALITKPQDKSAAAAGGQSATTDSISVATTTASAR
jgi:hypothetical protein